MGIDDGFVRIGRQRIVAKMLVVPVVDVCVLMLPRDFVCVLLLLG